MKYLNDEVDIHREGSLRVTVVAEDGGSISSQNVEAQILMAILEKLEEIRFAIDSQSIAH